LAFFQKSIFVKAQQERILFLMKITANIKYSLLINQSNSYFHFNNIFKKKVTPK